LAGGRCRRSRPSRRPGFGMPEPRPPPDGLRRAPSWRCLDTSKSVAPSRLATAKARASRADGHRGAEFGRPHPVPPQKKNGRSPHQNVTEKRGIIFGPRVCDAMRNPYIECGESSFDAARGRCPKCYMRDFRRRHRMKVRDCRNCGVSFAASRCDALYCSQACRQRAHRKPSQRA
jgi:hypothetical protein